jgi:hypothetical protein
VLLCQNQTNVFHFSFQNQTNVCHFVKFLNIIIEFGDEDFSTLEQANIGKEV